MSCKALSMPDRRWGQVQQEQHCSLAFSTSTIKPFAFLGREAPLRSSGKSERTFFLRTRVDGSALARWRRWSAIRVSLVPHNPLLKATQTRQRERQQRACFGRATSLTVAVIIGAFSVCLAQRRLVALMRKHGSQARIRCYGD